MEPGMHPNADNLLASRFDTVIYDLDGTLIDSARDPLGALIAASFLEHQGEAGRLNGLQNGPLSFGLCPALQSALASLWLPATPPALHPAMAPTSSRPSP